MVTSPGNPARLPPSRDTCPLCSHAAFKVATSGRRPKIVQILKKLWITRKDLAQAALDIRTWKGDRAAETYVGKMPKSVSSNTPQSDWPQLLLQLGAACAREKSKKKDRRRATKALRHLLTCTDSAYQTFYDLHPDFLRRHGTNVEEKLRKLPLSFLATPGLECAVWPDLYWHCKPCETVTRANHENRQKRRRAARQQQTGDSTSSSNARVMNQRKPTAAKHPQTLE